MVPEKTERRQGKLQVHVGMEMPAWTMIPNPCLGIGMRENPPHITVTRQSSTVIWYKWTAPAGMYVQFVTSIYWKISLALHTPTHDT